MKVIKEGDLGRMARTRRFACKACGCVFDAGPSEYRVDMHRQDGFVCACECPTCGQYVFLRDGEGVKG